jgi:hypothetical protein
MSALIAWVLGGLLRWTPSESRGILLGIFAFAVVSRDLGMVSFPLPQSTRQVPRTVFDKGPARAAFRFGFELGTGLVTYVSSGGPYILLAVTLLLVESPLVAIALGLSFGFGRFLTPFLRSHSPDRTNWLQRLESNIGLLSPLSTVFVASAVLLSLVSLGMS